MSRHIHRRRKNDEEDLETFGSVEEEPEAHHHHGGRATTLLRYAAGRLHCKHLLVPVLFFLGGLLVGVRIHGIFADRQHGIATQQQLNEAPSIQTQTDVCIVANAVKQNVLNIQSYYPFDPVRIPNDSIPHVSSVLCSGITQSDNDKQVHEAPLKSVFVFKAARTGSTFVTQVITNTIQHMGLPASMFWEPYANIKCNGPQISSLQTERALKTLLTKQCIVGPNPAIDKCKPDKFCNETSSSPDTVFVTATNPRFLNSNMDWNNVLDSNTRILSLRRTNLVLLSYSKYNHGGCRIDGINRREPPKFTLLKLLRCSEHYGFGDQELSTSIAFHAASSTSTNSPFLVVYEDVTTNGALVQQGITNHLGLNITRTNMFEESNETEKEHAEHLCDYKNVVHCNILRKGLANKYPCLYKQLQYAHEGWTWTVPMFSNGTLSIYGDCKPLPPLTAQNYVRTFDELYQLV